MKIGIIGCSGRMGQTLVSEIITGKMAELSGGTEQKGNKSVGKDLGLIAGLEAIGIRATDNNEELVKNSDAIIDFSTPESSVKCAELCAKHKKIHVIGTTGFSDSQKKELSLLAEETTIIWSPNMSIGVNVVLDIVEKVAKTLDDSYDIEIVEMHHNQKVDAPSGTALALGKAAALGRGVDLKKVEKKVRDGFTGPRKKGEIGFATLRGGDVVGDHTVIFASNGDRIEITHKASSRVIFVKGAIRAALWAKGKKSGLYSIKDVIED